MIVDVPHTTLVQYENLAAEVGTLEYQKDIITQALREILQTNTTIIEETAKLFDEGDNAQTAANTNVEQLKVYCVSCGNSLTGSVNAGTVRINGSMKQKKYSLSFNVNTGTAIETWKTNLEQLINRYYISSTQALRMNEIITIDKLSTLPCKDNDKCDANNSYPSVVDAINAMSVWPGKMIKRNIESQKPLLPGYFTAPDIVRAGDTVKIKLSIGQNLRLEISGKAMRSGANGSSVSVEVEPFEKNNREKKRIIDAVVTGSGEVSYAR